MVFHKDIGGTSGESASMHNPYRQVFADSSARTGDSTTYAATDLYMRAIQVDTGAEYYLSNHSPTTWTQFSAGAGSGDVTGPGSSTDNAVARFDLATGKIIQNSVVIIDDTGNITGVATARYEEQGADPTAVANTGFLYSKDVSGTTEAFWRDSAGNVVQITSGGSLAAGGSHAGDHVTGGGDEIDGDKLDIDWNPSNYSPTTAPTEADNVDNLTAHLAGIDAALAGTGTHASTHIKDGSDEVDGDQLDIDTSFISISPDTTPAEVTDTAHLGAILKGIDNALPYATGTGSLTKASLSANQTSSITAGSPVLFDQDDFSVGNDIGAISSNSWVLQPGKTYRLMAHSEGLFNSGDSQLEYQWYDLTGSASLGQIGNIRGATASPTNASTAPVALAIFTPTVASTVELRIVSNISSLCTNILAANTWATLEVIHGNGIPQTGHMLASLTANQTSLAVDGQVEFNQVDASVGNLITLDTTTNVGRFTLQGGYTYKVHAAVRPNFSSASGQLVLSVVDITGGNVEVGSRSYHRPYSSTSNNSHLDNTFALLSPTVTSEYEIQADQVSNFTSITFSATYLFIEVVGPPLKEKSFVLADLTVNQTTGLTVSSPVQFDRDLHNQGQDIGGISSNSWVLQAGRTYLMQADCSVEFSASNGVFSYHWYDLTGSVQLGLGGAKRPHTFTSNFDETERAIATFTPTVDSTVELRITANTALSAINAGFTHATIETVDGMPSGESNTATAVTAVKTSAYTAVANETVLVDPSSGGFTVTLPTAVGISGKMIEIKNTTTSTNTVTIDGDGSETIDGQTTRTMTTAHESMVVRSDGTNWWRISG